MRWFDHIFKNTDSPLWLRRLNYISLAGIIAWPLVFFASIFMFDDPSGNFRNRVVYWFLINSYPLILLILSFISFSLARRSPLLAAVFPSIPLVVYAIVIGLLFFAS